MHMRRIIGIVFFVIGAAALGVFLLADVLGYGRPGFGIRQIIGTIGGAITVVVGLILLVFKK